MKLWRSLIGSHPSTSQPTSTSTSTDNGTRGALPEVASRSLRLRLLFWIVLALLPVAFVSVLQGFDRVGRDVTEVRDRLVQTARATASDEENVLASAEQILRAIANQPEVRGAGLECGKSLANALKGLSYFVNLTRIGATGDVLCAAVMPPPPLNIADRPWWRAAQNRAGFFVTPQVVSTTVHRPVLGGILPLRDTAGRFDGVVAVGLDVQWLDFMLHAKQIPSGAVVAIFDPTGAIISSNMPDIAASVFRVHGMPTGDTDALAEGRSADGARWSYALVPLTGTTALLGLAMPDDELFAATRIHVGTDLLLPVLMLGLASAAIWIATDRQVTRWIVYLRRITTAYARGHYAIRPLALDEAPSEFRALGETFSAMAAAVQDRDRRLREALAQKTLLIRETHHRVKNNLQIVMSLLSLQAAQLRDPAAQAALKQAQMRVNALALIHRILHEIEDQGEVDLKRSIQDLAQQIQEGFGAERRDLKLEVDIVHRLASSDLAVPLTLFTVEALTNAFKYAYPPGGPGGIIRLSLVPTRERKLLLTIEDDGVGNAGQPEHPGIGTRLIQAFAHQLGGTAVIGPREGGGTRVTLTFPDPLFIEAAKLPEQART